MYTVFQASAEFSVGFPDLRYGMRIFGMCGFEAFEVLVLRFEPRATSMLKFMLYH